MTADVKRHPAPDGGYGWVIVAATAISNVINVPILQGFALLFRNIFVQLEMTTTDISMIINVNSSFGFMLGLLNGPMLKTLGYRKVGLIGSLLIFVGNIMTSRATSFPEFIIFYGLMNSAGLIMTMCAFSLAMNTYFVKRRSRASGVCMTATGLGPVFMPLVMSQLIKVYGERGTALIMSGLTLNTFCCVMLLHPVKWHYVKPSKDDEEEKALKRDEGDDKQASTAVDDMDKLQSEYDHIAANSVHNLEPALVPRRVSDASLIGRRNLTRSTSCYLTTAARRETRIDPDPLWWSKSSTNLSYVAPTLTPTAEASLNKENGIERKKSDGAAAEPTEGGQSGGVKWYRKVFNFFDLDLLTDRGYVAIWLGMSIAFTAEINFSLMTPIILGDRGFDIEQTARIMSVIGTTDIVFRFLAPFLGDRLNVSARYMYTGSIVLLIVFRATLTFTSTYMETMAVCAGLGIAKGFRTVYMTLVIPNYVPLEKLPSASGLQTVLNGILLMLFGPLLGQIRDVSGSYNLCIHAINTLSAITVTLWVLEYIFFIRKSGNQNSKS